MMCVGIKMISNWMIMKTEHKIIYVDTLIIVCVCAKIDSIKNDERKKNRRY